MDEECKHNGWRYRVRYPIDSKTLKIENLTWCEGCGKLIKQTDTKIQLPD